jgi:SAM-dependent methyltransferase
MSVAPTGPLRRLARRLPAPLYRLLRRIANRLAPSARGPSGPRPGPGPLIRELAPRLAQIPGWFNLDDLAHFTLVLKTQSAAGTRGDLLEIGCFHGRSAAVLAINLQEGEHLLLADAFDLPLDEPYGDTPTVQGVRRNLERAVPDLQPGQVTIERCYSRDLRLPTTLRVRFAHVDGAHDAATVQHDLALCAAALLPGGIIAVDDHAHPEHPGVSEGIAAFLAARQDFTVLADLNRGGALGRKLYLVRGAAGGDGGRPGPTAAAG